MNYTKPQLKKIIRICQTPESFVFDFIEGSSQFSDIRRMKEYVNCVKKVERSFVKRITKI